MGAIPEPAADAGLKLERIQRGEVFIKHERASFENVGEGNWVA